MHFCKTGFFSAMILCFALSFAANTDVLASKKKFKGHEREQIVARLKGENISLKEFEAEYLKNAGSLDKARQDSISTKKQFLQLYSLFKMKLREAEERGYSKDPAILKELNDYKRTIGTSYLQEKYLVSPAVEKLYDRRKYELRVSHIMIAPDSTTSIEKCEKLAQDLILRLNKGEKYEDLARKYSKDNWSKNSGGDIYYLTAGQIGIPDFEDAMYNTEPGHFYPKPVKTRYGYHIIKVTEKRLRTPQVKASHILLAFLPGQGGKADTIKTMQKADSIREAIKSGAKFEDMAKKFSFDKASAQRGGDLGYFERGAMVREFDQAAFNLKVNEISLPVKTRFGYHLILVTDRKPYGTMAEEAEATKQLYQQRYYNNDLKNYVDGLKKEFSLVENTGLLSKVAKSCDSLSFGRFFLDKTTAPELRDSVIFSGSCGKVSLDSLMKKIGTEEKFINAKMSERALNVACQEYAKDYLLDLKAKNLEKDDPKFLSLMDDYKKGIYIFKLQEDEVWNKIKPDSLDLLRLYDATKDSYRFNARVKYQEIYTQKDSIIKVVYAQLRQSNGSLFDSLKAKYGQCKTTSQPQNGNEFVDTASSDNAKVAYGLVTKGEFTEPIKDGSGFVILRMLDKDRPRIKTFEEARAEVSGKFQELEGRRLETSHLDSLKAKYKPVYYYDVLEKAFK